MRVNETKDTPTSSKPELPDWDALNDKEVKAVSDKLSMELEKLSGIFRGAELYYQEVARKVRWKRRKDHRIIECWRNAAEEGRGKFTFIITKDTFERIIQYIEDAGGYSSEEVVRVLYAMFYDGATFAEVDPQVTRKTVTRQLQSAFQALDLLRSNWKQPSLWTIKTSHEMLKDAEEAEVDLRRYFMMV